MDCICGKCVVAILPEISPILEKYQEIVLDMVARKKLLQINVFTIDRLLCMAQITIRNSSATACCAIASR